MKSTRRLVLNREALTELTPETLREVVGGATVGAVCPVRLTVLVNGCASDPRICNYNTSLC
ncbi:MAG: hypothetical protein QOE45_2986 [Frankiaceae bacterium]|jgi:hypothetical protein|nr:hypothetical protein [Frankiaceae bacterium]